MRKERIIILLNNSRKIDFFRLKFPDLRGNMFDAYDLIIKVLIAQSIALPTFYGSTKQRASCA